MGQYTGRGPIGALGQLCPLFKGKFNIYLSMAIKKQKKDIGNRIKLSFLTDLGHNLSQENLNDKINMSF